MANLEYEKITRLKNLTNEIIRKTCTIKDIRCMIRNLEQPGQCGCDIVVASHKIRVSQREYSYVKNVLDACLEHLEEDIYGYNQEIRELFENDNKEEAEDDRDQPEPESEVH